MIDDGSPDFDPVFAEAFANAEPAAGVPRGPGVAAGAERERVRWAARQAARVEAKGHHNRQPARTREVNQPKQIEAIDVAERRIALAREFNTVLKK